MRETISILLFFFCCSIVFCRNIEPDFSYSPINKGNLTDTSYTVLKEAGIVADRKRDIADRNLIVKDKLMSVSELAEALNDLSGIQIKDYGGLGGMKSVNVRSLGSEHTSVFIDGMAVENTQNMQVDVSRYSSAYFNSVSLVSGVSSNRLKSAREAGASSSLFFVSGNGEDLTARQYNVGLNLMTDNLLSRSAGIDVSYKTGKNIFLNLNVEHYNTPGDYKFRVKKTYVYPDGSERGYDTLMRRQNAGLVYDRLRLYMSGKTGSLDYKITTYYYSSSRGLPGPVIRTFRQRTGESQYDRNAFLQFDLGRYGKGFHSFSVKGKFACDYLRYVADTQLDNTIQPADNHYVQPSAYISVSNLLRLSESLDLNLATDFAYNRLYSDNVNFAAPDRFSFYDLISFDYTSEDFVLNIGSQFAYYIDNYNQDKNRVRASRKFFSPYISVDYYPAMKGLKLSSFAKKSHRMPTFNDLYYVLIGNVNLLPETAYQFDLALTYDFSFAGANLSLGLDGYVNLVDNKIVAIPTYSQFRWSMYNIGKVRTGGFESYLGIDCKKISARFRYTFQSSKDFSDEKSPSYGGQIPYIPVHSLSFQSEYDICGFKAGMDIIANGTRWSKSANLEVYRLEPYFNLGLNISKKFVSLPLILRLSASNLLDAQYQIVQGYPMPGRIITLSLTYNIKNKKS